MSQPRARFVVNSQRATNQEVINIDFGLVMRQAVYNERARLIREFRKIVETTSVDKESSSRSYTRDPKLATNYRDEIRTKIDSLEQVSGNEPA